MKKTLAIAAVLILSFAAGIFSTGCGPKNPADFWAKKLEKKGLSQSDELKYRLNLAYALDEQKRYDEALKQYNLILAKKDPKYHYIATNNMGNTLYNLERYQEALALFESLVKDKQNDPTLWNNIAHCYHGMQQYGKAKKAYEKALKLRPGYRQAEEGLQYLKQDMARAATAQQQGGARKGEKAAPAATGTAAPAGKAPEAGKAPAKTK